MQSTAQCFEVTIFGGEFGCERREGLETRQNDRLCLHLFSLLFSFYCEHGKVHLLSFFFF